MFGMRVRAVRSAAFAAILLVVGGGGAHAASPGGLAEGEGVDTTLVINDIEIVGQLKQGDNPALLPVAVSTYGIYRIEELRIGSLKDLSHNIPNFYIPDYGSRMTSSVYVRGLGARIDQPVVGLYVDNIPYVNKNNFDFDFYDIQRINMLRGPQGTLYGRNTMGGVVTVSTLSPMAWEGTRLAAEYGSGNSLRLKAMNYSRLNENLGISAGGFYGRTDGFFTNMFDGSACGAGSDGGGRLRVLWRRGRWSLDNSLSLSAVSQRGYPYAAAGEDLRAPAAIAYNDPCSYRRFNLSEGLSLKYEGERTVWSGVTSYQYTDDCMLLDQDFTPLSMFTLKQAQREHALTQEVVVKSRREGRWQWLSGAFFLCRLLDMDAPVRFKHDGIEQLILANANRGLQTVFPGEEIRIGEDEFDISSSFRTPLFGAALYHQSTYTLGRWEFTAGLRLDYEHLALRYDSHALIHYLFTAQPDPTQLRPVETAFKGRERLSYFELLPRVAVRRDLGSGRGHLYASVAKGYKAGGFNTQMFSDILQNGMMDAMMSDMGVHFSGTSSYEVGEVVTYKPEYSWNYELGARLSLLGGDLGASATLFWIECRNQQLTVFPEGTATGRMMTNAGRSTSCGAEVSVEVSPLRGLTASLDYGFTDARFRRYNNGQRDYSGNRVPYAPRHTLALNGRYIVDFSGKWVERMVVNLSLTGAGRMEWNEDNSLGQPFYSLLGGSVSVSRGPVTLDIWGRNITGTAYNTFYFVSVGNAFLQRGKPAQVGVTLRLELSHR